MSQAFDIEAFRTQHGFKGPSPTMRPSICPDMEDEELIIDTLRTAARFAMNLIGNLPPTQSSGIAYAGLKHALEISGGLKP